VVSWDDRLIHAQADAIQRAIVRGLSDGSPETRATARELFIVYTHHFPNRRQSLFVQADPRIQKMIIEMEGSHQQPQQGDTPESNPTARQSTRQRHCGERRPGSSSRTRGAPSSLSRSVDLASSAPRDPPGMLSQSVELPSTCSSAAAAQRSPRSSTGSEHSHGRGAFQSGSESAHSTLASPAGSLDEQATTAGAETHESPLFHIGDRIQLHSRGPSGADQASKLDGSEGIVQFVGPTKFASGLWIGIELEQPFGKHNGSVMGDVYFSCKPLHGIFVRQSQLAQAAAQSHAVSNGAAAAGSRILELNQHKTHVGQMLKLLEKEMSMIAEYEEKEGFKDTAWTENHRREVHQIKMKQLDHIEEIIHMLRGESTARTTQHQNKPPRPPVV